MAKIEDFKIEELVEALQGTTESIEHFLPNGMTEEDLTEEDQQYISNEIFLCATCGWWCEICQNVESDDGDMHCSDCKDEDEDGDEDNDD